MVVHLYSVLLKNTSLSGLNITISIAICVLISFILLLQINISQVFQVSRIPNKNAVTVPWYWYLVLWYFFSGPIVKVIPRHSVCISETLMFSAAFFKKKKILSF